jgi:hypothetical protein
LRVGPFGAFLDAKIKPQHFRFELPCRRRCLARADEVIE